MPEVRRSLETPMDYVERLAREKALSVPGELVLGADTTVVVRERAGEAGRCEPTRCGCCSSCRAEPTRWSPRWRWWRTRRCTRPPMSPT